MKISVKKAVISLVILAIVGIIAVVVLASKKDKTSYSTATVSRSSIVQTVNETGTVKAVNELDLSLMNNGEIAKINYKVGDKVKKDAILLELDYAALILSKEEANANLTVAQQNLNMLMAGATKEERELAKAGVNQAKVAYEASVSERDRIRKSVDTAIAQAKKTLADLESNSSLNLTTVEQAVLSAQNTLKNTKDTYQKTINNLNDVSLSTINDKITVANKALDVVYSTLYDETAEDYIGVKDAGTKEAAEASRKTALSSLTKVNSNFTVVKASPSNSNVIEVMNEGLYVLNQVFDCLELTFTALDKSVTSALFSQSALDSLKTSISSQQTAIAAAITYQQTATQNLDNAILSYETNVSSAENALAQTKAAYDAAVIAARNALESAEVNAEQQKNAAESRVNSSKEAWQVALAQLNKTVAAPDSHDRSLLEARITQAMATLNNVNKQIENSILKSPIDGTITKINYDIGEQVLAGSKPVASVLGDNNFEIEVMISEADISKIKTGDPVEITLDAYGEDVKFDGKVFFIEPAETVIQDVIYYKVKINFSPNEREVKSGMTANVVITTSRAENVLTIPIRAIIDKNGSGKFVRVLVNNQLTEKQVTIGLRGDDGLAEVISGLNENEEIVTFVKKE
jgi:RND family efflux transporter MFP subunit